MVPRHAAWLCSSAPISSFPLLYINNGVLAGGDYPVQATVTEAPPAAPVIKSRLVSFGVPRPLREGGAGKR